MDKCNSIEHDFHKKPNMCPNLNANISNEQQLRLNKINEIKYYLLTDIREGELTSKNLSKYIASFEYFPKLLIFICSSQYHFYCIICKLLLEHLQEYWGQVVVLHFQLHQD